MTRYAWEYQWSSAAYHLGDVKKDILFKSRNLYCMVKDWRKYLLETTEDNDNLRGLKRATRTGRPAGDHDFIKKIEKITGRTLQRQKPGTKKKVTSK